MAIENLELIIAGGAVGAALVIWLIWVLVRKMTPWGSRPPEMALDDPERARVLAAVTEQPGLTEQDLGRTLQMPSKPLARHLKILQMTSFIKRQKRHGRWTWVPLDAAGVPGAQATGEADRILLELLRAAAVSNRNLAVRTGLDEAQVRRLVRDLVGDGFVHVPRGKQGPMTLTPDGRARVAALRHARKP